MNAPADPHARGEDRRPPVRVGTAGWSYRDWEGIVYPRPLPRGFDRLRWMAALFDLVEINVSFYRIPPARTSESWVERVGEEPGFSFSAKVPRPLTHESAPLDPALLGRFEEFLRPLGEAGRLSAILAQFPWSFRARPESLERLQRLRDRLTQAPLIVEVRHGSWTTAEWMERLREQEITIASIDQPVIGDSIEPRLWPRAQVYVRFHGRNRRTWFDANAGRDERYDYEYSLAELAPWVEGLRSLPTETTGIQVVTNNHFEGQAVINGLELKALLGAEEVVVPEPLAESRPHLVERLGELSARTRVLRPAELEGARAEESPPAQRDLFDAD